MRPCWKLSDFFFFMSVIDIWSRSSFRVTRLCMLPQCWCQQNNSDRVPTTRLLQTNKTHFCCKFRLHSLHMKPFEWSELYLWPKMAFKMSHEFPAASWDITEDFHIWLTQCLPIHLLFHPQSRNTQLRASLSGTFLQTLPDLVTPLKVYSLSPVSYTHLRAHET